MVRNEQQVSLTISEQVLTTEEARVVALLAGIEVARENDVKREKDPVVKLEFISGKRRHNPLD